MSAMEKAIEALAEQLVAERRLREARDAALAAFWELCATDVTSVRNGIKRNVKREAEKVFCAWLKDTGRVK